MTHILQSRRISLLDNQRLARPHLLARLPVLAYLPTQGIALQSERMYSALTGLELEVDRRP